MENNIKLDTHYYDGKIDKEIYEYIKNVKIMNKKEDLVRLYIMEVKKMVIDKTKNKNNYNIQTIINGIDFFMNNEFDNRNNIDVHTVFIIAWWLCKKREEYDLFFLQIEDMINTNGTCIQGRVNRCMQIINALK